MSNLNSSESPFKTLSIKNDAVSLGISSRLCGLRFSVAFNTRVAKPKLTTSLVSTSRHSSTFCFIDD